MARPAPMSPEVDELITTSGRWSGEMAELRGVLVACDLVEEVKWSKPCYTDGGKNIAIMQDMTGFLALMFFKGALLEDPDGLLEDQGPNSRSAKRVCFTSIDEVRERADAVRALVDRAIAVEASGARVEPAPEPALVAELAERLDADPTLRAAFEALTPGRRREYHLFISAAKRPETRAARVERNIGRILEGKGLRDR